MKSVPQGLFATVLGAALSLSGCASGPPTAPGGGALSDSDFGQPPADRDALIISFLRDRLKDPSSAQIDEVRGPSRVTQKASLLGPGAYGWGVCFRVNAKNSFGGYVGFRTYVLLYRDGQVLRNYGSLGDNVFDQALAKGLCEKI